ncbi:small GTPase superfamily, Rab type, partial [Kipferlia bialata]
FDVTQRESFESVTQWLTDISSQASSNIVKVFIGNKTDLHDQRVVSYAEAEALAFEHGMTYIETSAKSHTNVEEAFHRLAQQIYQTRSKEDEEKTEESEGENLEQTTQVEEGCGC